MADGNRNTGYFGSNSIESNPQNISLPVNNPQSHPLRPTSEGFQFSFNDTSKEERKLSGDPSPSPKYDSASKNSPISEELSMLQSQIQLINTKISHNLTILKEKQSKTQELKSLLEKHENKPTNPTDSSVIESKCLCNQDCKIL